MQQRAILHTDLLVSPLCLGGNVFGWTADEAASHRVLDAYVAGGGNFIDTADAYSSWVPGNPDGVSELIIGSWLSGRGDRDALVIATKVGMMPGHLGLARENILRCAEESIKRLRCDYIDLYYAHADDPAVPLAETLGAFDELVKRGLVRHIAASNYDAPRLREALELSDREGLARFVALQTHYNLMEREEYERSLRPALSRVGLQCLPYYSLASGFLTGKYQHGSIAESVRAEDASKYLTPTGSRVLEALATVAGNHQVSLASVALAWLASKPEVLAPIASATTPEQLADLMLVTAFELDPGELDLLDLASGSTSGQEARAAT